MGLWRVKRDIYREREERRRKKKRGKENGCGVSRCCDPNMNERMAMTWHFVFVRNTRVTLDHSALQ